VDVKVSACGEAFLQMFQESVIGTAKGLRGQEKIFSLLSVMTRDGNRPH
jgi:hypothetical protein